MDITGYTSMQRDDLWEFRGIYLSLSESFLFIVSHILNEISNVIVIIVVLTTITTIATTITIFSYQVTSAISDDDDRSISPNYREGYEIGKVHGREDNRSGNEHNDRCPQGDNNILRCIGYEIGYNDGYYGTSETREINR
jgi:hypothetical protein